MGLYLYSRPINQLFKRSIRLWSEWFYQWIFDSFFNLQSIHNNSFIFHIKDSSRPESFDIVFQYVYVCIYVYPSSFLEFRWKDSFTNATQPTPFVRTASIESLHLSFFSELLFVFGKQDLAQDCPFLIPGFLWIWKLSLSKFPYQGSIQLSP